MKGSSDQLETLLELIENRRAINDNLPNNKIANAVNLLSTWGGQSNPARKKSLLKNKLAVSNEGWIGLIGRLSAALDEIGVDRNQFRGCRNHWKHSTT